MLSADDRFDDQDVGQRSERRRASHSPTASRPGRICPIPTTSVPAAPLLLCCLQDSVARLAPGASNSPVACSRAPCTDPALSGCVRTGGDVRESGR